MYKHRNHRLQGRNAAGQFERATLANTFGMETRICAFCGALNPYEQYTYTNVGGFVERTRTIPPDACNQCGQDLNSTPESEFNLLIMLG